MGLEISGVGGVNYPSASENPQPFHQMFGLILDNLENYKAHTPLPVVLSTMLQYAQDSISKTSPNYKGFTKILSDINGSQPVQGPLYITASDLSSLKKICQSYSQASSAEFVFDPNPISSIKQWIDNDFQYDEHDMNPKCFLNEILGLLQILQNFTLFDSQKNHDLSTDALCKINQAIESLNDGKFDINFAVEAKLLVNQIVVN